MARVFGDLRTLWRDRTGLAATEYAMVVATLLAAVLLAFTGLASRLLTAIAGLLR